MKNEIKIFGKEWIRKTSKPKLEDRPLPAPSVYGKMFADLKAHNLAVLEEHYGPRCKSKDYEDFPELDPLFAVGDPDAGRCPVCLVYEKFDKYWETLYYADHDDYLEVP